MFYFAANYSLKDMDWQKELKGVWLVPALFAACLVENWSLEPPQPALV